MTSIVWKIAVVLFPILFFAAVAGAFTVSVAAYLRGASRTWNRLPSPLPVSTNSFWPSPDQPMECPKNGIQSRDRLRTLAGLSAPTGKTYVSPLSSVSMTVAATVPSGATLTVCGSSATG